MTRMPHSGLLWLVNLLVPGTGLVLLGRLITGALVGFLWAVSLSALLVATLVWPEAFGSGPTIGLAGGAAAVYVAAQVLLHGRQRAAARHLAGEGRDERFRSALVATLQGRLDDAENTCRELLKRDPDDVVATLHLATLARRRGDAETARKYLRRARYLDEEGGWDFQIGRELETLSAVQAPPAG